MDQPPNDQPQAPSQQQLLPQPSQPPPPAPQAQASSPQPAQPAQLPPQLPQPPPVAHPSSSTTNMVSPINITSNQVTHIPVVTTNQINVTKAQNLPIVATTAQVQQAPLALTIYQQPTPIIQLTLANRPPSTLPVVPITTAPAEINKADLNKPNTCCLLDNDVKCDRIAGNASFSARIQKIVSTKKMNYVLDPTVRHQYICEHHKAILCVAKKSTVMARDNKSNAKNSQVSHPVGNRSDLSRPQQNLPHLSEVNYQLLNNQNRPVNNNVGPYNNLPVRPGTQIAYAHYQKYHPNQVTPMDDMMSGGYENSPSMNAGGDSVPSNSGNLDVDLSQLQVNTLRRYKRHFRVQTKPGLNKMQLAESLKSHFRTLPIIEKEAITYFVYIVKCYRNKLDHNPKAD